MDSQPPSWSQVTCIYCKCLFEFVFLPLKHVLLNLSMTKVNTRIGYLPLLYLLNIFDSGISQSCSGFSCFLFLFFHRFVNSCISPAPFETYVRKTFLPSFTADVALHTAAAGWASNSRRDRHLFQHQQCYLVELFTGAARADINMTSHMFSNIFTLPPPRYLTFIFNLKVYDVNCERTLKLRCDSRFQHAFTACSCVFKEITLVRANQRNFFENATACSKRTLKRVSQRSLILQILQAAKIMRRFFYEAPAEIMRNYTTIDNARKVFLC